MMSLDRMTTWKSRIAGVSAAACIVAILCVLDGSAAYLREPFNSLQMLPGSSIRLTGPLPPDTGLDGMTYESSSNAISMSLEEVISGFWMGGRMWRGTLAVGTETTPGKYFVSVLGSDDRKKVGANTFLVLVYKDRQSEIAHSISFLKRHTGVSPWTFGGLLFFLVLLGCGSLYLIGIKRDRLMAEQGEAEVYHVIRNAETVSLYFGLGRKHGVEEGGRLLLMDGKRRPIEEITVESASEKDALAKVGPLSSACPGYIVKKV